MSIDQRFATRSRTCVNVRKHPVYAMFEEDLPEPKRRKAVNDVREMEYWAHGALASYEVPIGVNWCTWERTLQFPLDEDHVRLPVPPGIEQFDSALLRRAAAHGIAFENAWMLCYEKYEDE